MCYCFSPRASHCSSADGSSSSVAMTSSSSSSSSSALDSTVQDSQLRLSCFPDRKFPVSATPEEVTRHSMDHSYVLSCMMRDHYVNGTRKPEQNIWKVLRTVFSRKQELAGRDAVFIYMFSYWPRWASCCSNCFILYWPSPFVIVCCV